jgi:hypothetical protein
MRITPPALLPSTRSEPFDDETPISFLSPSWLSRVFGQIKNPEAAVSSSTIHIPCQLCRHGPYGHGFIDIYQGHGGDLFIARMGGSASLFCNVLHYALADAGR